MFFVHFLIRFWAFFVYLFLRIVWFCGAFLLFYGRCSFSIFCGVVGYLYVLLKVELLPFYGGFLLCWVVLFWVFVGVVLCIRWCECLCFLMLFYVCECLCMGLFIVL